MTTPATVGEALLQDIIADPADDGLRLIYADWLQDNGQPERAEFIRVQVDLAKRDCVDNWCEKVHQEGFQLDVRCELADECDGLRLREKQLLNQTSRERPPWPNVLAWAGAAEHAFVLSENVVWRRGFLVEGRGACQYWLKWGPQIVREHPLEQVAIHDREPMLAPDEQRYYWMKERLIEGGWDTTPPNLIQHVIGDLWDHLPSTGKGKGRHTRRGVGNPGYDTPEAAHGELSDACLTWARSIKCLACNDTGKVPGKGLGDLSWRVCPECKCRVCNGSGVVDNGVADRLALFRKCPGCQVPDYTPVVPGGVPPAVSAFLRDHP